MRDNDSRQDCSLEGRPAYDPTIATVPPNTVAELTVRQLIEEIEAGIKPEQITRKRHWVKLLKALLPPGARA